MAYKTVEGRSAARRSRPSEDVARQTDTVNIAPCQGPANALTAVMDPHGLVIAIVTGRAAARAYLRGGCV